MPIKRNQALIYRDVPGFLKQLREDAGLTQRDLAERLGDHQSWVARCETGSRRMDIAEFVQWCAACGIEPGETLRRFIRQHRR